MIRGINNFNCTSNQTLLDTLLCMVRYYLKPEHILSSLVVANQPKISLKGFI